MKAYAFAYHSAQYIASLIPSNFYDLTRKIIFWSEL